MKAVIVTTCIFYPTVTPHKDILLLGEVFKGLWNIFLLSFQHKKEKDK